MRAASASLGLAVLVAVCSLSCLLPSNADSALGYLDKHTSQYTQELIDLVNIPSISSLPGAALQLLQAWALLLHLSDISIMNLVMNDSASLH